jgi:glutamyl-tRNA reductase
MPLFALGVSHHTALIEQREKVSLSGGRASKLLKALAGDPRVAEAAALSTCNRTEIYAVVGSSAGGYAAVSRALAHITGVTPGELTPISYALSGMAVVRHLMRVAASLDSMVIGESEIQGQVRAALHLAEAHGTAGSQLGDLFRGALIVGKRVRRVTGIGHGAVSVSSVAVELARRALPDLAARKVVLAGAGQVAEATARALAASGGHVTSVANRSVPAARELAERFGGRGVPLDALADELRDADIVICSTDSPGPILGRRDLQRALAGRSGQPLVLIDIAVPRDVEPVGDDLPHVILRDIDDLEQVVQANLNGRRLEAERAERIVEQELWRRRSRAKDRPSLLAAHPPAASSPVAAAAGLHRG